MVQKSSPNDTPYLIVGLGNPGSRYATTRHNVGFLVVDELARRYGLRFSTKQANAEVARGDILGTRVILAKPQTYMNNSGQAVRGLASYFKIPVERILIIYDEIALPVGTIRLREKGSSAGHNGVNSVIQHMGTQNVARIRVGVDRPIDPRHSQIDWVLGRFTKEEQPIIEQAISRAADAVEAIFKMGMERAMNTYNMDPIKDEAPKTKDERRPTTAASGTTSDGLPSESTPQKANKNDLSMGTLRERVARIMHRESEHKDV
jgi:peptidyl-tRNA hydrolase, PTH1 family